MNKIYSGKEIPGMIEPVEQALLETLAKEIYFDREESVVEFGTFFGRSTACIASGLKENKTFRKDTKFYAFDSFECDLTGSFYPHVLSFAQSSNCQSLLKTNGSKIDFYPIFEKYLKHYIENEMLVPVRDELVNSFPENKSIKLMHIDSPKFYDEFKFILYRFFPYLKLGANVVFQDFFYHWSASLIAVIGIMIKNGFLTIINSAASSLSCRVLKTFDTNQICNIDLIMNKSNIVPDSIDFLLEAMKGVELDRKDIFLPRLKLAKIQWLFENGNYTSSVDEIVSFFNQGNRLDSVVVNDFLELMRFGFSIRHLYNIDHS